MTIKELKQKVEAKVIKTKAEQKLNDVKTFIKDNQEEILTTVLCTTAGVLCVEAVYCVGYLGGFMSGLNVGWDTCAKAVEVMVRGATNA